MWLDMSINVKKSSCLRVSHRRRSGWTSGGTHGERRRWVRAEWVGYGGCPLSSRLRGLGERRELPQRGPGQSPGQKRILAYFEGYRTLIFVPDKIWGRTICISVPHSKFWGTCPPVPPWSTLMASVLAVIACVLIWSPWRSWNYVDEQSPVSGCSLNLVKSD